MQPKNPTAFQIRCRTKDLYTESTPIFHAGHSASPLNHRQSIAHDFTLAPDLKCGSGRLLARLSTAGQYLVGTLLHAHLALHLLHLLLLAERQRPGDAEQKRAGADDPKGFTTEAEARGGPVVGCVGGGRQLFPVRRGHDVGERGDAIGERFFVVVGADGGGVGFCGGMFVSWVGRMGSVSSGTGCLPESVSQSSSSSILGPCCWALKSSSGTSSSLTILADVCG
jgi:hypothetical protein